MGIDKDQREDPKSVSYDPTEEQRELEAAGWECEDRQGKLFWRNPQSGHVYPQGAAMKRLQEIVSEEEQEDDS